MHSNFQLLNFKSQRKAIVFFGRKRSSTERTKDQTQNYGCTLWKVHNHSFNSWTDPSLSQTSPYSLRSYETDRTKGPTKQHTDDHEGS